MSLAFLRGQVRYLVSRGWRVTVITSPGPGLAAFCAEEGCDGLAIPLARAIDPWADVASIVQLVAALRRLRPDIVHAHTPKGGLLGMIAAVIARVPHRVFHLRGALSLSATGARKTLFQATERWTCSLAHRVVSVSASLRDWAVSEGLVDADRVEILLHGSGQGVDARGRFHPAHVAPHAIAACRSWLQLEPEDVVVLFVGRLVGDKGIVELEEAWRSVRAQRPNARLVLAGPAEARDGLSRELLAALAADPTVRCPGSVDGHMLPALYAIARVLVLPTWREGFPNVVLEAAAMRVPVIATRVIGCVDGVDDGVTGTLVPVRDAVALAEAMVAYVDDAERAGREGVAGRKRVLRKFERGAFPRAIEAFYERLMERGGAARGQLRGDP